MCLPHIRWTSNLCTTNNSRCLHGAEISPSDISLGLEGWFGAKRSALGLWLELRVCLRHLFARKFGQHKAEGGGVLLNGFLSVETPWRTVWYARAWAKVPRGRIKPHLAKLSPSASSMHLLLFFPQIVLSQVRNIVGITMRAESTKFSLQPESFSSHIPPCCWTFVGSSLSSTTIWKCPTSQGLCSGKPTPRCGHLPSPMVHGPRTETDWGDLPRVCPHAETPVLRAPPNTDEGPQAKATPTEGAPKHKSDGGVLVCRVSKRERARRRSSTRMGCPESWAGCGAGGGHALDGLCRNPGLFGALGNWLAEATG